jgi:ABC-type sugar transport system substrate-binding protein
MTLGMLLAFTLSLAAWSPAPAANNDDLVGPGLGVDYGFGKIGFDLDTLVKRMGPDKVRGLRIGIGVNTLQNNWQLMWVDEFERLATKYGFRVSVLSANDDSVKQADDLKDFESQQVDGVILFPHSTSAASAPATALNRIIPVVTAIPLSSSDAVVACTINVKQTAKGAMIADKVAADAKGTPVKILTIDHSDDISILNDRIKGFAEQAAKNYPNLAIVAQRYDKTDDGWLNVAKEALLANDAITVIVASYSRPMMGGYNAAHQLGRNDIKVYGVDADEVTLKLLEEGKIQGLHVQWPQAQAYTCLFTMLRVLNGDQLPPVVWEADSYAMSYATRDDAKKMLDILYPAK